MNILYYRCSCCDATMHCKARPGSNQFGGSWLVQHYLQVMCGEIVDDPQRPAATSENLFGREVSGEDHPDCNFVILTGIDGKFDANAHRRWAHMQPRAGRDLVLRISVSGTGKHDYDEKKQAIRALNMLLEALTPKENPGEYDMTDQQRLELKCALTGGHDWVFEEERGPDHRPLES